MNELDETDLEILRLLAEDARRPYSDIGEHVNLSGPAVSDRVNKLEEQGIIRQFTVDIDRARLHNTNPLLVRLQAKLPAVDSLRNDLRDAEAVEHVFSTADAEIIFSVILPYPTVGDWLQTTIDMEDIRGYDIKLLADSNRSVSITGTDFALTCAECGNTVSTDGTATRIGGQLRQFCCVSCETTFEERYEAERQNIEA
jgi:DNA-binding Lrp family transcriptional regulator